MCVHAILKFSFNIRVSFTYFHCFNHILLKIFWLYRLTYDSAILFRNPYFITVIVWTLIWLLFSKSTKGFHGLTHWGRVTHICVSKLTIIGSDNGLSPGRRQAIILTNAGIFLIGPLRANFSEILIEIHTFSFNKMHLNMSSAKWRQFCLGLNVLSLWCWLQGYAMHSYTNWSVCAIVIPANQYHAISCLEKYYGRMLYIKTAGAFFLSTLIS